MCSVENTDDWTLRVLGSPFGVKLFAGSEEISSEYSSRSSSVNADSSRFVASNTKSSIVGSPSDLLDASKSSEGSISPEKSVDLEDSIVQVSWLANGFQFVAFSETGSIYVYSADLELVAKITDFENSKILQLDVSKERPAFTVAAQGHGVHVFGDFDGVSETNSEADNKEKLVPHNKVVAHGHKINPIGKYRKISHVEELPDSSSLAIMQPDDDEEYKAVRLARTSDNNLEEVEIEDACPPFGDTSRAFAWFSGSIQDFPEPKKYTYIAACSQSPDMSLMEDTTRLALNDESDKSPLTEEDEDVVPVGASLMKLENTVISPSKSIERAENPPFWLMLTQEGRLLAWNIVSKTAAQQKVGVLPPKLPEMPGINLNIKAKEGEKPKDTTEAKPEVSETTNETKNAQEETTVANEESTHNKEDENGPEGTRSETSKDETKNIAKNELKDYEKDDEKEKLRNTSTEIQGSEAKTEASTDAEKKPENLATDAEDKSESKGSQKATESEEPTKKDTSVDGKAEGESNDESKNSKTVEKPSTGLGFSAWATKAPSKESSPAADNAFAAFANKNTLASFAQKSDGTNVFASKESSPFAQAKTINSVFGKPIDAAGKSSRFGQNLENSSPYSQFKPSQSSAFLQKSENTSPFDQAKSEQSSLFGLNSENKSPFNQTNEEQSNSLGQKPKANASPFSGSLASSLNPAKSDLSGLSLEPKRSPLVPEHVESSDSESDSEQSLIDEEIEDESDSISIGEESDSDRSDIEAEEEIDEEARLAQERERVEAERRQAEQAEQERKERERREVERKERECEELERKKAEHSEKERKISSTIWTGEYGPFMSLKTAFQRPEFHLNELSSDMDRIYAETNYLFQVLDYNIHVLETDRNFTHATNLDSSESEDGISHLTRSLDVSKKSKNLHSQVQTDLNDKESMRKLLAQASEDIRDMKVDIVDCISDLTIVNESTSKIAYESRPMPFRSAAKKAELNRKLVELDRKSSEIKEKMALALVENQSSKLDIPNVLVAVDTIDQRLDQLSRRVKRLSLKRAFDNHKQAILPSNSLVSVQFKDVQSRRNDSSRKTDALLRTLSERKPEDIITQVDF